MKIVASVGCHKCGEPAIKPVSFWEGDILKGFDLCPKHLKEFEVEKKGNLQKKVALVTGCNGQDGSYLMEFLLEKGYHVHGIIRRSSAGNTRRIDHILEKITLHFGDLSDVNSLTKILQEVMPDEIYNFAAMSQVRISYDIPAYTGAITGLGFANLI